MKDSSALYRSIVALFLLCAMVRSPTRGQSAGPSGPHADAMEASMARWAQTYRQEMTPVREQWSRVVLAIHEGRISDLPTLCPGFKSAVGALDRCSLLTATDPQVRANVEGTLDLLDIAAGKCHRSRFFDLSFQLYKARYLIEVIDRRLLRYK